MKPMSAMRSASSRTRTCDRVERHVAALHQVDQPARGPDDDVDAAPQRVDLGLQADAAVDRADLTAAEPAERLEHAEHLVGELAGRDEDEAGGPAGLGLGDPLEQREAEGEGLARAGLGLAAEVVAGEGVGDGQGLDRERRVDAVGGEARGEVGRDAERLEGGSRDCSLSSNGMWCSGGAVAVGSTPGHGGSPPHQHRTFRTKLRRRPGLVVLACLGTVGGSGRTGVHDTP